MAKTYYVVLEVEEESDQLSLAELANWLVMALGYDANGHIEVTTFEALSDMKQWMRDQHLLVSKK